MEPSPTADLRCLTGHVGPCRDHDLVDPITISGKLVRVVGEGLKWIPATKSDAGLRTLPLAGFALDMLTARRSVLVLRRTANLAAGWPNDWR